MQTDSEQHPAQPEPVLVHFPDYRARFILRLKIGIILAIVACIITCVVMLFVHSTALEEVYKNFVEWMKSHVHQGAFLFVLIQIVTTPLWFPLPIFKLAAGFAVKQLIPSIPAAVAYGTFLVFTGAMIGSLLSFFVSRYLISSFVRDMTKDKKIVKALQETIKKNGVKILIFIRMTPIIPYNLLNYLLGISEIKVWQYLMANFGLLPGIIIQVFIGTTISSIKDAVSEDDADSTMDKISIGVSVSACIIGAIGMICIARKIRIVLKLQSNKIEEEKQKEEEEVKDS
jgi:uncharacterized membrane protein YdjX (TVP38/TMEM64 family)